ncbi:hypothetical protein GCM10027347_11020 [Larkinella harenae]
MNKKQKILIVDDDAAYRQLLTLQLTRAGYEVLIANDGREVLNWLRSEKRPDLLLLDLLMPHFSGLEVLESLRASSIKLPVILISGADLPIARQGVSQAAPDAFLMKPFAMQDLLVKIEGLLETYS